MAISPPDLAVYLEPVDGPEEGLKGPGIGSVRVQRSVANEETKGVKSEQRSIVNKKYRAQTTENRKR
jgi:hypothetical protein